MRSSRLEPRRAEIMNLLRHHSKAEVARRMGVPVSTLKSFIANPPPASVQDVSGDVQVIEGTAANPDALMRELGVDPDEWEPERCVVNRWADHTQLKVQLRRKTPVELVLPATDTGYVHPGHDCQSSYDFDAPLLVVICGDQQAPYHDERLHELFQHWLIHNTPDAGILIGDTLDLPTISRYRDNPEWGASVQECIQSGYDLLRDYVRASEQTTWTKLLGNHDERIRNEILARAERLYNIRPADVGDGVSENPLSLRNLLRLDQLRIELIESDGNYDHAGVRLSQNLGARHGWLSGNNTAKKTLDRLGHSVYVGHSHAKSTYYDTIWDINNNPNTRMAMEIGTMAQIHGGLGHTVNPNWQQGFATATLWPDGRFVAEHAVYVNETLLWRDQRYE